MPSKKDRKTKKTFQAPKGMRDILPDEQIYWEKIRQVVQKTARSYGFERLETPILEEEGLFVKSTGTSTDIVQKEMYSLKTKGGDRLVLRPEFTPAFIRAYLEDGLSSRPHPLKLYTTGPLFRYERAQKGRYRQHEQANFEILGEDDPVLDAQLIQVFFSIVKGVGLKDVLTQINSIGCRQCRPNYRKKLVAFYGKRKRELCADCQKRLKQNPLRLLDCKNGSCIAVAEEAPQTIDNLCPNCHNHFRDVLEYLDELGIPYILNPRLVRGLDYYTRTVFEVWPEEEENKEPALPAEPLARQSALGGGGRYDNLVKTLGGKDISGIGFGLGIDRLVNFMRERKVKVSGEASPSVFLVQLGELGKKKALKLFEDLRQANIKTASQFSKDTMKAQLKLADKAKTPFALILGQKEALDGTVIIRNMDSGSQETVLLEKVVKELKKRIKR